MSEGNPGLPFGGAKKSGFGRLRGPEGLLGFTYSKAVLIDRAGAKIEANWYPYTSEKDRRFGKFADALYSPRWLKPIAILWHGLRLEAWSQKARPTGTSVDGGSRSISEGRASGSGVESGGHREGRSDARR